MDEAAPSDPKPINGLPFAQGRSFAALDDYLAHLRDRAGPVGQPWYREIGSGLYERVSTRVPAAAAERLTRTALMARYGFTR
jgi:hypothetical protein